MVQKYITRSLKSYVHYSCGAFLISCRFDTESQFSVLRKESNSANTQNFSAVQNAYQYECLMGYFVYRE